MLRTLISRIRATVAPRREEEQVDEEIRGHLEMLEERFAAQGMSPEEARRQARLQFGGVTPVKERLREQRQLPWFENAVRDMRYAMRRLGRDWPFAASAVVILAAGIGANTAVFSVVNAVLLRPQSFEQPDELVRVYQNVGEKRVPTGISMPALRDIEAGTNVFSSLAAVLMSGEASYQTADGVVHPCMVEFATSKFLDTVALRPFQGRWFTAGEDTPGAAPAAVIGYKTWQEQFHADPAILGQSVRIGRAVVTIAGIAPPELHHSAVPGVFNAFWLSVGALPAVRGGNADALERRDNLMFQAMARLRPGTSLAQAQAAMDVAAARLRSEHGDATKAHGDPGAGITVLRARDVRFGPEVDAVVKPAAFLILAIAALILAIACGNLATIQLVRGTARAKEIALRVSLGATRAQLVRHLLAESLVLAVAGAVGGWLATEGAVRYVHSAIPVEFGLDVRVLLYVTLLALLTGIGAGLAPALASTKSGLASGVREQSGVAGGGQRWFTLKNSLIVMKVAASFLLLVVTGFGVRVVTQATAHDPGFAVDGLAIIQTDPRATGQERGRSVALMQEFVRRVEAIPGVESVVATNGGVPPGDYSDASVEIDGVAGSAARPGRKGFTVLVGWGAAGFVETLRLPVLFGRGFDRRDRPDSPRVAVLNESMARRYFGTLNAVGRRFRYVEMRHGAFSGEAEVVGVVRDAPEADSLNMPQALFYLSSEQSGEAPSTVVARTSGDAQLLVQRMQGELRALHPAMPVMLAQTMRGFREDGLRPWATGVAMLGGVSTLGLGLAALGLYAVVAFAVARRAQEVGIRMALGARAWQVVRLMIADVAVLTGVGIAIGAAISVAVLIVMGAFGTGAALAGGKVREAARDPWNFVVITGILAGVGLLAAYVPARRAARIDPVVALREG